MSLIVSAPVGLRRMGRVVETDAHEGPVYVAGEDALYFTTQRPEVAIKRLALDRGRFPLDPGRITTLPFDANWPSAGGGCAMAISILGDRALAAPLYELLLPYAGRPLTADRAVCSYGAADRFLGLLAHVLGRDADGVAHIEAGIALDATAGVRPSAIHGRLALAAALGEDPRAAELRAAARAEARELDLAGLLR